VQSAPHFLYWEVRVRKGVNFNGSNKESSEETGKEDRKKEIVSIYTHTHFFGWRRNSPAFFLRSSKIMKLYSAEKFK
jgi:hypothetical protein